MTGGRRRASRAPLRRPWRRLGRRPGQVSPGCPAAPEAVEQQSGPLEGPSHLARPASSGPPSPSTPSPTAAHHLGKALSDRTARYHADLTLDLTMVETLLDLGEVRAAARALGDHRQALQAFSDGVETELSDAVVEREAEDVLDHHTIDLTDAIRVPAASESSHSDHRGRQGLAGVLAAAAIAAAVVVPGLRPSPAEDVAMTADERSAAIQLAAARAQLAHLQRPGTAEVEVTAGARALHDQILALPAEALTHERVRGQVRALLEEESGALRDIVRSVPSARGLLEEVRALSTALGLDVDVDGVATDGTASVPRLQAPTVPEAVGDGAPAPRNTAD